MWVMELPIYEGQLETLRQYAEQGLTDVAWDEGQGSRDGALVWLAFIKGLDAMGKELEAMRAPETNEAPASRSQRAQE